MKRQSPIRAERFDARGFMALVTMALHLSPADSELLVSGLAMLLLRCAGIASRFAAATRPPIPRPRALGGAA